VDEELATGRRVGRVHDEAGVYRGQAYRRQQTYPVVAEVSDIKIWQRSHLTASCCRRRKPLQRYANPTF